jgi:hypothetical protein
MEKIERMIQPNENVCAYDDYFDFTAYDRV